MRGDGRETEGPIRLADECACSGRTGSSVLPRPPLGRSPRGTLV